MRIVRRRGLSWKEAANKAAAEANLDDASLGIQPGDKWGSLIRQLKTPNKPQENMTGCIDPSLISSHSMYKRVSFIYEFILML